MPISGSGARGRIDTIKGNVEHDHVQIKVILENTPLMGRGRLPKWLRDKKSVISLDDYDDNLCFWRCLLIFFSKIKQDQRATGKALDYAKKYYNNKDLKVKDVEPTNLLDIDAIAEFFKINIRVFEFFKRNGVIAWQLIVGRGKIKED